MEGIFPLTLQGLNRERAFQHHLIGVKVGGLHHLRQQGQQMFGIFNRAAQAQDQSVLLGVAAKSGPASLHEVGQLQVVVRSATPTEQGRQQIMGTPCPGRVLGAAEGKQQFRGQNPWGRDGFDQKFRVDHPSASLVWAVSTQACSG